MVTNSYFCSPQLLKLLLLIGFPMLTTCSYAHHFSNHLFAIHLLDSDITSPLTYHHLSYALRPKALHFRFFWFAWNLVLILNFQFMKIIWFLVIFTFGSRPLPSGRSAQKRRNQMSEQLFVHFFDLYNVYYTIYIIPWNVFIFGAIVGSQPVHLTFVTVRCYSIAVHFAAIFRAYRLVSTIFGEHMFLMGIPLSLFSIQTLYYRQCITESNNDH